MWLARAGDRDTLGIVSLLETLIEFVVIFTKQASSRNLECFNLLWSDELAKPNYAFAKRQRDLAKKQKKEAKLQKKAESDKTSPATTDEQSAPAEKIVPQ